MTDAGRSAPTRTNPPNRRLSSAELNVRIHSAPAKSRANSGTDVEGRRVRWCNGEITKCGGSSQLAPPNASHLQQSGDVQPAGDAEQPTIDSSRIWPRDGFYRGQRPLCRMLQRRRVGGALLHLHQLVSDAYGRILACAPGYIAPPPQSSRQRCPAR